MNIRYLCVKNVCVMDYFCQTEMVCIIESINKSHARGVGGSIQTMDMIVCAFVKGNR